MEVVPLDHGIDAVYRVEILGDEDICLILAGQDTDDLCEASLVGPVVAIYTRLLVSEIRARRENRMLLGVLARENETILANLQNRFTYLNGCSALKRLEAVGCENGMLESSLGEDPVDDRDGARSVGPCL